ncbi:MAG: hypothetical protein GX450_01055 [Verrucomicrobia bacterium]|nr:hypothetical protein [Verrucomicrobiota bacterium]
MSTISQSRAPSTPKSRQPFAWQDKNILRRIREEVEDYGTAISVYVALCFVASDKEADQFTTTHEWLAQLSGASARTVRRRLTDLQRIKAVEITTPPMRAPSTYRLLDPEGNTRTFGHCGRTLGHGGRALGHGEALTVAYIRSTTTEKHNSSSTELSESWLGELASEKPYQQLDLTGELAKARRWCLENRRQCTRRFFVNWLNRCRPAKPGTRDTERLRSKVSDLRAAQARETDPQAGARIEAELEALTAQIAG